MRRGLATLLVFAVVAIGYTVARQQIDGTATTTTIPTSENCISDQLTSTWVDGTGAAGTLHAWVEITNTSSTACSIPSHPILASFTSSGGLLPADFTDQSADGQLVDVNDNPIPIGGAATVRLEPGRTAAIALSFVNDASCSTVSLFRLSWEGGSTTLAPHYLVSQCNGPSGLISKVYLAS